MKNIKLPLFDIKDTGVIKEVKRGIVRIEGLTSCINGQLIQLRPDLVGSVIGFDQEEVSVLVLGDENKVNIGNVVYGEENVFKVPASKDLIGRIVDIFGNPRDGKGKIGAADWCPVFRDAPGVMDREPVSEPIITGINMIDTLIPIGRGQRELILGDRVTGKTTIATDAMINQKDQDVICIFCWIGGSRSSFIKVIDDLKRGGAMDYTIVVSALASDSPAQQYLAPYVAAAIGEFFMYGGKDVLIAFDNLTKHAWSYRQLSLLLERSPGREAYPGDIFFLHSQLMERATRLNNETGGGSITFLPIVETQEGDITGLVPSNLVSMTDGQIYLNANLFNEGFRPAIDSGLSVSRIGSKVQCDALKEVARPLKREFAQYKELLSLLKIRTKLSEEIEAKIKKGSALRDLFIQDRGNPNSLEKEIILFYAFNQELPQILDEAARKIIKEKLYPYIEENHADLIEELNSQKMLTGDITRQLDKVFNDFFRHYELE
jgi:F-type H+-transporting ATPase subunit alpha